MKKEDVVRVLQALPEELLKPGRLVQVQTEVGGGGDQVEVCLEVIANVEATYSGEDEKFNHLVFYRTVSGKTLGYDLEVKNWWMVEKHFSAPNTTSPVHVFTIAESIP